MRRFLSPGWLLGHLMALVAFAVCLVLGWWQVQRAGDGNPRSWAYAVEWPIFAGFVVFVWVREVQRARASPPRDAEQAHALTSDIQSTEAARAQGRQPAQPETRDVSVRTGDQDARVQTGGRGATVGAGDEDEEVAAYNRMLAWLHDNPQRHVTDYPG